MVKHKLLVDLLQALNIDQAELQLLTSLYWNQTAAVRCDHDINEYDKGCGFSTFICLVYRSYYEGISGHERFQKWWYIFH